MKESFMWERFKGGMAVVGGIAALLLMLLAIGALIEGGTWLGAQIYPWLLSIFSVTLAITILLLIPMSLFSGTRGYASIGLVLSSYLFGLTLWMWGLLLTYSLWGVG